METIISVILMLFNIIQMIFGLLLIAASIWFYLEIQDITSLRDPDHYRMISLSWPEAIPWIFMVVGLLVLLISCCGCAGARWKSRGVLTMFVTFEIVVVLSAISAVAVTVLCADTKVDGFIRNTMLDGFNYMTWNSNPQLKKSFGEIESNFFCCGASQPGQYRKYNTYTKFPESCCDTSLSTYNGVCDFENETANNRLGCIDILGYYSHKIITGLCAGGALAGVVGLLNITIAIFLMSSGKKQNTEKKSVQYHEADTLKC